MPLPISKLETYRPNYKKIENSSNKKISQVTQKAKNNYPANEGRLLAECTVQITVNKRRLR